MCALQFYGSSHIPDDKGANDKKFKSNHQTFSSRDIDRYAQTHTSTYTCIILRLLQNSTVFDESSLAFNHFLGGHIHSTHPFETVLIFSSALYNPQYLGVVGDLQTLMELQYERQGVTQPDQENAEWYESLLVCKGRQSIVNRGIKGQLHKDSLHASLLIE